MRKKLWQILLLEQDIIYATKHEPGLAPSYFILPEHDAHGQ
jgi:hypothetical protein